MMRKRLLLILGCLASMLLAGYVTLRLTAPRHRITKETIEKIQKGMTEEEIEAVFGVPAGVYGKGALTGVYAVAPPPGTPQLLGLTGKHFGLELIVFERGKEWVGEDVCVYCRFDEASRVQEIHRGNVVPGGNESFLAKLRRWLGI
jgi:hypothetical protein